MVIVAQLVRAPGCGPGGRGFKSPHSPHIQSPVNVAVKLIFGAFFITIYHLSI